MLMRQQLKTGIFILQFVLCLLLRDLVSAGCNFPTMTDYNPLPSVTIWVTGQNSDYQLGDGTNENKNDWVESDFQGSIKDICATRYNSYLI